MTSSTPTTRPAGRSRRALGTAGVAVAAAGVTTLASAFFGAGPTPASADPGDTYVPTSTSQLVQSDDLDSIQVPLDTEKVVLKRDSAFSSCLGPTTWTAALPGSPRPVTGTWSRRGHAGQSLTESVAQAPTEAVAESWEAVLVRDGIRDCRKPTTALHFGAVKFSAIGDGFATWAVSYHGLGRPGDGGVAVVRHGTSVGFVEVKGHWGPAWQTMESVAKVSAHRLG